MGPLVNRMNNPRIGELLHHIHIGTDHAAELRVDRMVGHNHGKLPLGLPSKQGPEQTAGAITGRVVQAELVLYVHHVWVDSLHSLVHGFIPPVFVCIYDWMYLFFTRNPAIGMANNVNLIALMSQRFD
jgi:hypothetical protein